MPERWQMEGGGTLTLQGEGLGVRLEAVRPDDSRGLYKAWIFGPSGEYLLGTLVPEGKRLRLSRWVSRQSLAQAGCWPVRGGRTALAFSFSNSEPAESAWKPEPCPERLCGDPLVRACVQGRPGFYRQRTGEEERLSAPFQPGAPFPIPPLFCLARVERRDGQPWLVWSFSPDGVPQIPEETGGGEE